MRNRIPSLQQKRFERAVKPYLKDLRRLALRFTGNDDDADDLLQELATRLQGRLDEVAQLEQPRPWLARALYRLFVDQWRRQRARPESDDEADIDAQPTPTDAPDEVFERSLTRERLQAALDALPAFQRELVILHDVEGYTLPEISTITGSPLGTLKSRLHRARTSLREYLLEP